MPSKHPLHSIRPPHPHFWPKVLHRFIAVCSKRPPSLLCSDRAENGTCIVAVPCTVESVSECIRPWAITTHYVYMYKELLSMRRWAITKHQKLPAPSKRPPPIFESVVQAPIGVNSALTVLYCVCMCEGAYTCLCC